MCNTSFNNSDWTNYPIGTITSYGTGCISGMGLNDIFATGSYMEVVHYNGSTWYNYKNEIPSAYGTYSSVTIHGNIMVAVGLVDQNAVLLMGTR
jgi:hypothetical protein